MSGSYEGHLPYTDEMVERVDNSEHVQSGTVGMKRVTPVDQSGNALSPLGLNSAIVTGTKTVTTAGTAVRITAVSTPIKGIFVNADLLAGIVVTVGDSSVVGNASGMKGIVLTPGNPPIFLPINDLSLLYVDAVSNGGKLAYAALT